MARTKQQLLVPGLSACVAVLAAHAWSVTAGHNITDAQISFGAPLDSTTIRILAAERKSAAAAVLWVLTVQRLGDARFQALGAPYLEGWVERIQDLEPALETPPLFGSLALMASRPAAAEAILERAERARPESFETPYYRAINAFFGSQDIPATILHLRRAAPMVGAPAFLARWATRLETQQRNCLTMLADLQVLKHVDTVAFASVDADSIYRNCVARDIEQASAAYRLRYNHPPASTDELLKKGFLAVAPPRPPGQCWTTNTPQAKLVPCPD